VLAAGEALAHPISAIIVSTTSCCSTAWGASGTGYMFAPQIEASARAPAGSAFIITMTGDLPTSDYSGLCNWMPLAVCASLSRHQLCTCPLPPPGQGAQDCAVFSRVNFVTGKPIRAWIDAWIFHHHR